MNHLRSMIMSCAIACVALLSVPSAHAADGAKGTAIGVQFGYPGNAGLSLRFDNLAVGAAWSFGDEGYLHATVDYWLLHNKIERNLNWYLGPGVNLGVGDPFMVGVRLPVGLQWLPAKNIEIFGEFAPCLWLV